MSEFELTAVSDLRLLYIEKQEGFSVYLHGALQLIKSEESTRSTSLLNYITGDVCELPSTAVKMH